jgi:hypothetical protein
VSTNSLCQGDQAPRLFARLIDAHWRVKFAHRTFRWTTEVPGRDRAVVHVIVVGFTRSPGNATLFDYANINDVTPTAEVVPNVNGYLVPGPHLLLHPRRNPLVPDLPRTVFGNMPRDGGHLLIEPDELDAVMADPLAANYVRPFVGASELLHNEKRWCLWLPDSSIADRTQSPVLRARLTAVAEFRDSEPGGNRRRAESTRQMAATPHLFGQRSQPTQPFIIIPRHVSHDRRYFVVAHYPSTTIVGDSAFHAVDPDGLLFGLISSAMFLAWQMAVGGRIKSDPRFANTLVWNNFPLPELPARARERIVRAGEGVQRAREALGDVTLADMYDPLAMDASLLRAHGTLDGEVDRAFGASRRLTTEKQRLELLFASYATVTATLV